MSKLLIKVPKLYEYNACDANYSGSTSFPNKGSTRKKNGAPAEAVMDNLPEIRSCVNQNWKSSSRNKKSKIIILTKAWKQSWSNPPVCIL